MRPIKFSYLFQHQETGMIMEQIFTIEQIEGCNFIKQCEEKFPRYYPIARRQFTGLTDKNGNEIYEGDIVIGLRNEERAPQYEVYFDSEILAFFIRKGDKNYHLCDIKEVEIIGNIYENPELLSN